MFKIKKKYEIYYCFIRFCCLNFSSYTFNCLDCSKHPIVYSDKSCQDLNQTLKTTSLVLLLVMLLTLLPAIYFIVQEMRSKEGITNPKSNKFLMIGLAAMVSLFAIVTPLLNRIAQKCRPLRPLST